MLYSTSLLLLVIIPIVAPLCFFVRQKYIRHEMEERLEKEQLVTVELTELRWYKPGKELVIEGKMFDVHAVQQIANNKYIVEGLFDEEEKKLFHQLNQLMKKKGNLQRSVLSSFALFCTIPPTIFSFTNSGQRQVCLFPLSTNQQLYSQYNLPVCGPPPRC